MMKRSDFLKFIGIGALVPVLPFTLYPKPLEEGFQVIVKDNDGNIVSEEILPFDTNSIILGEGLEPNTEYQVQIRTFGERWSQIAEPERNA